MSCLRAENELYRLIDDEGSQGNPSCTLGNPEFNRLFGDERLQGNPSCTLGIPELNRLSAMKDYKVRRNLNGID